MEKFAFVIHPLSARDVAKKYPIARYLPERVVEWGIKRKQPMLLSHITGVRSPDGREAEGWFIACPLTPRQLLTLPQEEVWSRLQICADIAREQGARIMGLGAFTSVVGDGGRTLAGRTDIAITTGNSYTVATAVQGARRAAELLEIPRSEATVAVVGATGSIGRTSARIMARHYPNLVLIGRSTDKLETLAEEIRNESSARVSISTSAAQSLPEADITITVTSAVDAVIEPEYLKRGSVVCDVARPRDVSVRVAQQRDDVLVIEGGVVQVPGDVEFNFDFGFPRKTAYACMSETMALALNRRYENYTLGKDVSVEQVDEITELAEGAGFRLGGFRSFEKAVEEETIERIIDNARRRRGQSDAVYR
ncbi:MAG: shikimate dehydrogenase [Armatimonadetes bacterium]|nr:shikimate dehydrogenase [Armatimonadota bacterium]